MGVDQVHAEGQRRDAFDKTPKTGADIQRCEAQYQRHRRQQNGGRGVRCQQHLVAEVSRPGHPQPVPCQTHQPRCQYAACINRPPAGGTAGRLPPAQPQDAAQQVETGQPQDAVTVVRQEDVLLPQGGQNGKHQHDGQRQQPQLSLGKAVQQQIEKRDEQAHTEVGRHIPVLPEQHREKGPQHPVTVDAAGHQTCKYRRDAQRVERHPQPQGQRTAVPEAPLNAYISGDQSVTVDGAVGGSLQQPCGPLPRRQGRRGSQNAALIQNMENDHHPHGGHPQQVDPPVALFHGVSLCKKAERRRSVPHPLCRFVEMLTGRSLPARSCPEFR